MQCGDVFVRSASDYHPGIIQIASSCYSRARVAAEWVEEDVVDQPSGAISNQLFTAHVRGVLGVWVSGP